MAFKPGMSVGGGGDVSGPGSSTDNAIVRWDGTAGDTIQNSGVIINDTNDVTGANSFTLADDKILNFGTSSDAKLLYETADANANTVIFALPNGDATNVPCFVIGDQTILNLDLGVLNGVTDPSIVICSNDATKFLNFRHTGSVGNIFSTSGGIKFEDNDTTSSSGYSFHFEGGSRSGITPSLVNVNIGTYLDYTTSTANFTAGTQGFSAGVFISGLTYTGTAPGTTIFGVTSLATSYPLQGSNATFSGACIAGSFGDLTGLKSNANNVMGAISVLAGIANGTGTVEARRGFLVSSDVTGGGLDLGNQTATLTSLTGFQIDSLNVFSTTNTRTIGLYACFYAGHQDIGSNITITNGPYSFYAEADATETSPMRIEGFNLCTLGSVTAANNITCLRPITQITGNTQINTIAAPLNNLSCELTLIFTGTPTVKYNTAGTGASLQLAGAADFSATAGDILTLVFDGTYWREKARTVI